MAGNQLQMNKKIAITVQELMDSMPYYNDLQFFPQVMTKCPWQSSMLEDGKIYIFIFSNLELNSYISFNCDYRPQTTLVLVVLVTIYPIEILDSFIPYSYSISKYQVLYNSMVLLFV